MRNHVKNPSKVGAGVFRGLAVGGAIWSIIILLMALQ